MAKWFFSYCNSPEGHKDLIYSIVVVTVTKGVKIISRPFVEQLATASFIDLVIVAQENSTNKTNCIENKILNKSTERSCALFTITPHMS